MPLWDLGLGSIYFKNETASQSQVQRSVLHEQLDMTKWYQIKFKVDEFPSSLS